MLLCHWLVVLLGEDELKHIRGQITGVVRTHANVILSCWNGGDKTKNREGVINFIWIHKLEPAQKEGSVSGGKGRTGHKEWTPIYL